MALLIRSVGGLSKCFYQGLWLAVLSADVIVQSINRRGVAWEFPYYGMVSSSVSARFLFGFPYRFQRAWTVLCSMKHPLDVVRVGAWNSLLTALPSQWQSYHLFNLVRPGANFYLCQMLVHHMTLEMAWRTQPLKSVLSSGLLIHAPIREYKGLRDEDRDPFHGQWASASNPIRGSKDCLIMHFESAEKLCEYIWDDYWPQRRGSWCCKVWTHEVVDLPWLLTLAASLMWVHSESMAWATPSNYIKICFINKSNNIFRILIGICKFWGPSVHCLI